MNNITEKNVPASDYYQVETPSYRIPLVPPNDPEARYIYFKQKTKKKDAYKQLLGELNTGLKHLMRFRSTNERIDFLAEIPERTNCFFSELHRVVGDLLAIINRQREGLPWE